MKKSTFSAVMEMDAAQRLAELVNEQSRLAEAAELSQDLMAKLVAINGQERIAEEIIAKQCNQAYTDFIKALADLDARYGVAINEGIYARGLRHVANN